MKVKIYGFDTNLYPCESCLRAKEFLDYHKIDYEFLSVIERNENGKLVHKESVVKQLEQEYGDDVSGISLPQIFVNGKYIGKFAIFKQKFLEGVFNGTWSNKNW